MADSSAVAENQRIMMSMNRETEVKDNKNLNSRYILRKTEKLLGTGRDKEGKEESNVIFKLYCGAVSLD